MKHGSDFSRDEILMAIQAAITWATPSASGISIAAFTDDNSFDDQHMLHGLASDEKSRAQSIADPAERRHYIARRCFQRLFIKTVVGWRGKMSDLKIQHRLDCQPKCLDAPHLKISFSSSETTALACASNQHRVGIDVEKYRQIENLTALAARFFTPAEAAAIASLPAEDQSRAFLKHWTAKEAGLKATGKGIVSGLNSFVLNIQGQHYGIDCAGTSGPSQAWHLDYSAFLPQFIVAIVHNPHK
jgi:phosphopantetheinyl transferase